MFRKGLPLLAVATIACVSGMYAQDCSTHNSPFSQPLQVLNDSQQHDALSHWGAMSVTGSCTYTDQTGTNNCAINGATTITPGSGDGGDVSFPYQHATNYATNKGSASSNGPAITFGDTLAVGVVSCNYLLPNCSITVTINGSVNYEGNGLGGERVLCSISPLERDYPLFAHLRAVSVPESAGVLPSR